MTHIAINPPIDFFDIFTINRMLRERGMQRLLRSLRTIRMLWKLRITRMLRLLEKDNMLRLLRIVLGMKLEICKLLTGVLQMHPHV